LKILERKYYSEFNRKCFLYIGELAIFVSIPIYALDIIKTHCTNTVKQLLNTAGVGFDSGRKLRQN